MSTLQFNCVGAICGLVSTLGAGLTFQGYTVFGVTLSVLAAATSIVACVSWFRGRLGRAPATIEPLR